MIAISNGLAALVAILHVYFLYLEMFMWSTPKGLRIFGQTLEAARASQTLAANQGLYNGFLAAGLVWGLVEPSEHSRSVKIFFFACVFVAGLYGGKTVNKKIFFIQAVPALVGLAFTLLI